MYFSKGILSVFLWKNFKRIFKNWISSIVILSIPIGIISFVFYVTYHFNVDVNSYNSNNNYSPEKITNFQSLKDLYESLYKTNFHYTPDDSDTKLWMKEFKSISTLYDKSRYIDSDGDRPIYAFYGYKTENDLYNNFAKRSFPNEYRDNTFFLIDKNHTDKVTYFLRLVDSSFDLYRHSAYDISDAEVGRYYRSSRMDRYLNSGFLVTQLSFEMSYLRTKLLEHGVNNSERWPTFSIGQTPLKYLTFSPQTIAVFAFLSLCVVIINSVSMVLLQIVEEKQDGVKEIIDSITTCSYLNHVSLYIIGFVINMFVMICLMVQAFGIYDMFGCTQLIYPIILIILFIICTLSFTFFISIFFDTVSYASVVGVLFYLLPYVILDLNEDVSHTLSFLSPMLLYDEGMTIFINFMKYRQCFNGVDIFHDEHPVINYTIFQIYTLLIVMSVVYLVLYYYLSNVFPGRLGTPKPYNFIFLPSFWCPNRKKDEMLDPLTDTQSPNSSSHNSSTFVHVNNLYKTFKRNPFWGPTFAAVKNVSFYLQENRITILLGHNGAGKTTIMNMITGILPPTAGSVTVDDQKDVSIYRTDIGYCPQHNIFISYLTCRDHLILFGRLRGLSTIEAEREADLWLDKVNLKESANKEAKMLSNEIKRRLALACAVIGNTKLVILDEPSTGLDPEARRDLWDVLLTLRKERTILLTTHSMEDADILGDKIIILDQGTVICEGTPLDLKKQYGSGYTLKVMMGQGFRMTEMMTTIQKYVPGAFVKSEVLPTIRITLPYDSMKEFSGLLKKLEDDKVELGIESISMTNTTMDEVFLKSASEKATPSIDDDINGGEDGNYVPMQTQKTRTAFSELLNHFLAIFYKKFVFMRKSGCRFFVHFTIPMLAVFGALIASKTEESWTINRWLVPPEKFNVTAKHIENQQIMLIINQTVTDYDRIIESFQNLAKERDILPILKSNMSAKHALNQLELENSRVYALKLLGALEIYNISQHHHVNIINQPDIIYSSSYCTNFAINLMSIVNVMGDNSIPRIEVINWPKLKEYDVSTMDWSVMSRRNTYRTSFNILMPFGFFFYILFYVYLPYKEESTEFRVIQKISPIRYWMATYLSDCILHTFTMIPIIVVLSLCDQNNSISGYDLSLTYFILCLVGYVYIAIMYFMTKLFKSLSSIYTMLFLPIVLATITSIGFQDPSVRHKYPFWLFLLRWFPEFNMRLELNNVHSPSWYYDNEKYSAPSIFPFIIQSIMEIVFFLALTIFVLENIYLSTAFQNFMAHLKILRYFRRKKEPHTTRLENPYVQMETEIVQDILRTGNTTNYSLIVSKLNKFYEDKHAVKGIDFTVKRGECFGLLGMSGAGKSSIFKMLTLNASVTSGDLFINGNHNRRQAKMYSKDIGYCPEMSALLDFMTAYETLKYMAMIKGTTFSNLDREVNMWLTKMDLKKFKNVEIVGYSGGTKRKLNTAIAMISDPALIFLDEPTSGVDPVSRRFMWRCIQQFQTELKTIVLTSHSMDECEELCNRLAIMGSGYFRCLGYIQQLKVTYGTGFTLLIKLKEGLSENIMIYVKEGVFELFQCKLRDDYAETLIFSILDKNILWSTAFAKVQEYCDKNHQWVEDFSITEISLEDIFLQFRQNERNLNTGFNNSLV